MKKKGEKTIFAVLLAALCGASLLGGCAGGVVSSVLSGEASQAETSAVQPVTVTPEPETAMPVTVTPEPDAAEPATGTPGTELEAQPASGAEPVWIGMREMDEPEGMAVYSACLFQYEGQDWELRAYAPSEAVIDGELALDDRCHFQLRAVSPDGVWVLFDDTVQLGVPQADVWVDVENGLHITLRDARSALYRITDYVYDGERRAFREKALIDQEGVNYWGQS